MLRSTESIESRRPNYGFIISAIISWEVARECWKSQWITIMITIGQFTLWLHCEYFSESSSSGSHTLIPWFPHPIQVSAGTRKIISKSSTRGKIPEVIYPKVIFSDDRTW
jgi:hypothetical protein